MIPHNLCMNSMGEVLLDDNLVLIEELSAEAQELIARVHAMQSVLGTSRWRIYLHKGARIILSTEFVCYEPEVKAVADQLGATYWFMTDDMEGSDKSQWSMDIDVTELEHISLCRAYVNAYDRTQSLWVNAGVDVI